MLYRAIRRLLFALDPEAAHEMAFEQMERIQSAPALLRLIETLCRPPVGGRHELLGLSFRSRVGIAAGFDKNAVALPMLHALGFGFLEVGTITLQPQSGNPAPRLFRVPSSRALINRMGFNNDGAVAIGARLKRWRSSEASAAIPLLVNVGKNRDVLLDDAPAAYAACLEIVSPHADACVINVSSPNTPSLRDLQQGLHLERILLAARPQSSGRPLLVKISPDLTDDGLLEVCDVALRLADGMICTNTTTEPISGVEEKGGVSGEPLREKSTAVLARVRAIVGSGFPLIGVGGVSNAAAVREKLDAGADLVQIYTGFVYEGPALPSRLARQLSSAVAGDSRA